MHARIFKAFSVLAFTALLTACNHADSGPANYAMGDKITVGPLVYSVIETNWYSQLGEGFKIRSPQQRFLAITLSITNSGRGEAAVPLLTLEDSNGRSYMEVDNGDGLENWMGLLRNVDSGQTMKGKILFDVPLTSYRLRLTDGGGTGAEKYAWVNVPLHLDIDSDVQTPPPGDIAK